jgi:hypothetical protein
MSPYRPQRDRNDELSFCTTSAHGVMRLIEWSAPLGLGNGPSFAREGAAELVRTYLRLPFTGKGMSWLPKELRAKLKEC